MYGSLEAVNYIEEPENLSDDRKNFIEASIISLFSWKLQLGFPYIRRFTKYSLLRFDTLILVVLRMPL